MTEYNELVRCGECKFWSETEKEFGRCLKSGFKTPKDFLGEDGERKDQGITDYTELVKALRCCAEHKYRCLECEFLHDGVCSVMHDAAAAIEALQAEVERLEPKRGEWISDRLVTTNGGTYGVRRCSACEAYYQDVGYGWDYCPNCGAKMEVQG